MTNKLLEIENLKLNFNDYMGTVEVLDKISFSLNKNSWLGLVGESGCGKSVTAFTILRLLPESAEIKNGDILFKEANILAKTEKEMQKIRGKEISMIFQEPQSALDPSMRIGAHITETIRAHRKINRKEVKLQALDILEKVEISNPRYYLNRYPHELSGGMNQRVCIALALVNDPSLLIADEFTTSLDVTIQKRILELVLEIQKLNKMSVLFITHDLALAHECCDYIVVMYAGQIVEKGRADKVLSSPAHPYTKALLNSIPGISKDVKRLQSIDGVVPNLIKPPAGCRFHTRCKHKIPNICDKLFPKVRHLDDGHQAWCHLL